MTERSVTHATFVIERIYDASPARVFRALSDPVEKTKWFSGPDDWESEKYEMDFKVGGWEHSSGGPVGGPVITYDSLIQDIVPDERIVATYEMAIDGVRISVSLATMQLKPEGEGTRLVFTEQGAFLDGFDNPAQREEGTRELLGKLDEVLSLKSRHDRG